MSKKTYDIAKGGIINESSFLFETSENLIKVDEDKYKHGKINITITSNKPSGKAIKDLQDKITEIVDCK